MRVDRKGRFLGPVAPLVSPPSDSPHPRRPIALGGLAKRLVRFADGHQVGYDNGLTRAVSEAVSVPVIASGGAGTPEDLYQALVSGKADAVLAASIFHYGTYSINEIKGYLAKKGVPIRS